MENYKIEKWQSELLKEHNIWFQKIEGDWYFSCSPNGWDVTDIKMSDLFTEMIRFYETDGLK